MQTNIKYSYRDARPESSLYLFKTAENRIRFIPYLKDLLAAHEADPEKTLHFILPTLLDKGTGLETLPIQDAIKVYLGITLQKGKNKTTNT